MKTLSIVWQRLIDSGGQTCERCQATYEGLQQACPILKKALHPLGIEVTFEAKEVAPASFAAEPSLSNRIWIAGKPIEYWLGANVASSPCCSVCGGSECRAIELGNDIFEAIPPELILKAALIAAAQIIGLGTHPDGGKSKPECCK